MRMMVQRKGIYLIDFGNEKKGSIQAGLRPGIVIQNNIGNQFSTTTIVIPCTTSSRANLPVHVLLKQHDMETGDLPYSTIVQCEQIRVINTYSIFKMMGEVKEIKMAEIEKKVIISLGIQVEEVTRVPFFSK